MSLSGTDVFARLLDASPSAIVVADLRGRVVLLNEAAQRLLRYGARDVKGGLHVADLYHRRTDARLAATRLKARPVGVHPLDEPLDVALRASNGDVFPARLLLSFLRDRDGAPVATLGVFQDRREVDALVARLGEVTAQVEVVERRASGISLAAAASHELAQPLTAALGQMEMLTLDPGLSPTAVDRIERVVDQLDRMRRIVREFTRTVAAHSVPRGERPP